MRLDPNKKKFLFVTDNTALGIDGTRYLGPYRVADELEKIGIQTIVIDKFYQFDDLFELLEKLLDNTFIGVGLSTTFMTPPEYNSSIKKNSLRNSRFKNYYSLGIISGDSSERSAWFRELKNMIDRKCPSAKIFVGGAKAQHFFNAIFDDIDEIDYLVVGATDLVFAQIIRDAMAGSAPRFKSFGKRKVIDTLNYYHQPKGCPRHTWRPHWFIYRHEALPIEISRGCAFNCKFCSYDKKESFRKSAQDLKEEFIYNFEMFGTQFYQFVDDCFNDHRKKVEEVCNLILSLPFKIEWASYMRFDVAVKFPETADLVVASGGRAFHWGVESLTDDVARRSGKGTPSEKIKDFMLNFRRKYDRVCYSTGSFICGLPGETVESWGTQVEWLLENDSFDFVYFGPLGVAPYKHEFDGKVVDYADYSRHPQKYGFNEVDPQTGYWRHDTMDLDLANRLSSESTDLWLKRYKHNVGPISDIWAYPQLRALGASTDLTMELFKNPALIGNQALIDKASLNKKERFKKYSADLWSLVSEIHPLESSPSSVVEANRVKPGPNPFAAEVLPMSSE